MTRQIKAVLCLILVAAVGALAPATARADPGPAPVPGGFASWGQLFDAQQVLDRAAGRILQANAREGGRSGYGNHAVDVLTRSLTLYWKGRPPASVQALIGELRAQGITVTVRSARYSKAELDATTDLVAKDASATGGVRVATITQRPDASGIEVGVATAPGRFTAGGPAQSARSLPNLSRALDAGGVSVVAVPEPRMFSREADTSPFWAGALIATHNNVDFCTTGFGVDDPFFGQQYILTAAHCAARGAVWQTGAGLTVGTVSFESLPNDTSFITTTPGGRFYDGPWVYQSGQFSKPVHGLTFTSVGDFVCVSGALTGAACWVRVDSTSIRECSRLLGCVDLYGGVNTENPRRIVSGDSAAGRPGSAQPA
ncbi:MAG: hypothetical protein AUI10_06945 [Actinobacteria bacterium 13_2_20CM_2_72_6]|nr:MAG: hypothetical protein AUI10_06945 [Actinobacteria bacterium 13_2_20CM_2_72_6]